MTTRAVRFAHLGPGLLVTAAFVGPGTVTTASQAGAGFGFALLWALVFSVVATIVLQEMAARLGLVTRHGLGEAVRQSFSRPWARGAACLLIVAAIGFGNAAYQTGNITGAAAGLQTLTGIPQRWWPIGIGILAFGLLGSGTYKTVERLLVGMVVLMSLLFGATAILVRPDVGAMLRGVLVPSVPTGSLLTIVALIGTTVVPYNLFLHSHIVQQKWPSSLPTHQAIAEARLDTTVAVTLGGLVTLAILATAAATFFDHATSSFGSVADMAKQLGPLLGGRAATACFGLGLLAAGLTSAITAPLAAAYATAGVMGWEQDLAAPAFRAVWTVVLVVGTILAATTGRSPAETIVIAQAANALLLPLIALFLLVAMNRSRLMGSYKNGTRGNMAGAIVVLTVLGLAAVSLCRLIAA